LAYEAFIQRLKRLDGALRVTAGGGGRRAPNAPRRRRPFATAVWLARKTCEPHVLMNALGLLAITQGMLARWLWGEAAMLVGCGYVGAMGLLAPTLAVFTVSRSLAKETAERELVAWYRPPHGR